MFYKMKARERSENYLDKRTYEVAIALLDIRLGTWYNE